MSDHAPMYAIVQKIWAAAIEFHDTSHPENSAYAIITPLVQELTTYVDEQVKAEREACVAVATKFSAPCTAMNISARSTPLSFDGEDGG